MKTRNLAVLLPAGVLLLASGRLTADGPKTFSHKFHLEQGAECTSCHTVTGPTPTLDQKACSDCHDSGAPAWKSLPKVVPPAVKFPHDRHAKAQPCLACHAGMAKDELPRGGVVLGKDACFTCHAQKKVAVAETACGNCHRPGRRRLPPRDHSAGWLRRHGQQARAVAELDPPHGKDCQACHGKAACASCHDQQAPRSHTGLWRVRTHGLAAAWDRDACRTCHETGTCIRCHVTTPPVTHNANWASLHGLAAGARDNEQCQVCHRYANRCSTCHP